MFSIANHCERLTTAGLTVRKDAHVVSVHCRLDEVLREQKTDIGSCDDKEAVLQSDSVIRMGTAYKGVFEHFFLAMFGHENRVKLKVFISPFSGHTDRVLVCRAANRFIALKGENKCRIAKFLAQGKASTGKGTISEGNPVARSKQRQRKGTHPLFLRLADWSSSTIDTDLAFHVLHHVVIFLTQHLKRASDSKISQVQRNRNENYIYHHSL